MYGPSDVAFSFLFFSIMPLQVHLSPLLFACSLKSFVRHQVFVPQKESHMLYILLPAVELPMLEITDHTFFLSVVVVIVFYLSRLIRGSQLELLGENP